MMNDSLLNVCYTNINVWKEKDLFDKGLSLVKEARRKKVLACRQENDRCRSLAAGLLIRYACRMNGLDYDLMDFRRSESGKPFADGLDFNVSHSGDFAALVAGNVSAGIDVDCLTKRFSDKNGAKRLNGIMEKCFDAEEKKYIGERFSDGRLSNAAILRATRVWTRKESFAKERGIGLAMDFSTIHTMTEQGFWSYVLPDDYVISVFSENPVSIEFPVCVNLQEMLG